MEMETAATDAWFGEWSNLEEMIEPAPETCSSERSVEKRKKKSPAEHGAGAAAAGWKKSDRDRLGDLSTLLWDDKGDEFEEVARRREMRSDELEEKALFEGDLDEERITQFRRSWNARWGGGNLSFDHTTKIMPMSFTYSPAPPSVRPCDTLQIYSAKVAGTRGGLKWPLQVFGMVAVRDSVRRGRNLVFYRKMDDCQTLTETDPYLILTGPTRPVVSTDPELDPVILEVNLKVKGTNECEDKYLSLLAVPLTLSSGFGSLPFEYTSKRSTMELTIGEIVDSVEATIFIRVIKGSWPRGFHGQFAAPYVQH